MGCPLVCAEHLEVKFLLLVSTRVGADETAVQQKTVVCSLFGPAVSRFGREMMRELDEEI